MRTWVPQTQREWSRLLLSGLLLLLLGGALGLLLKRGLGWYELRQAKEALREYNPVKALAHLESSLRYQPNNEDAHLLLARVGWQLEQFDGVEEHLRRYEHLHGQTTEAVQLEYLLLRTAQGDVGETMEALERYIEAKRPESAIIHEARAIGHLRKMRAKLIRDETDAWIELEPKNPRAYLIRGKSHLAGGNFSVARADLERALTLAPDNGEARFELADTLLKLGLYEQAARHFESLRGKTSSGLLREDPLALLLKLSDCYSQLPGQEEKASACIDEVLAVDPENLLAWQAKGKLAFDRRRYAEAAAAFETILANDALHGPSYKALAECYKELGREAEAERCLALFQPLERDLKRLKEIERKLVYARNDADLLYDMGELLFRNGLMSQALNYLERALKVDPGHTGSHRLLADYYARFENFPRLEEHLPYLEPTASGPKPR